MSETRTTLTSRERVNRALSRQDHDRVPRRDGPWPETLERWEHEGFEGDFQEWLGSDLDGICWSWPKPFPGQREIVSEDEDTQVIRDEMGKVQRTWKHKFGTPDHISFDCDSREKWEMVYKPGLLSHDVHLDVTEAKASFDRARKQNQWTYLASIESFEAIRQLMGDEVTLMSMAEDPEWIRDLSITYTDLVLRDYEATLEAGAEPDGIWVFGDIGYSRGPFFSPQMYRELIWPDHKRMGDWAHTHGMNGDIRPLIPSLIDTGADCLQPLEAKAGMDIRELVPQYGDRLSFFGNIDMTVAITNDRELVEHEVRSKLEAGMSIKGYLYHSDHSVPPQVSWETYQFIVELVDRYGKY
jgi:uroporphyrinogen decarboxylase